MKIVTEDVRGHFPAGIFRHRVPAMCVRESVLDVTVHLIVNRPMGAAGGRVVKSLGKKQQIAGSNPVAAESVGQ